MVTMPTEIAKAEADRRYSHGVHIEAWSESVRRAAARQTGHPIPRQFCRRLREANLTPSILLVRTGSARFARRGNTRAASGEPVEPHAPVQHIRHNRSAASAALQTDDTIPTGVFRRSRRLRRAVDQLSRGPVLRTTRQPKTRRHCNRPAIRTHNL